MYVSGHSSNKCEILASRSLLSHTRLHTQTRARTSLDTAFSSWRRRANVSVAASISTSLAQGTPHSPPVALLCLLAAGRPQHTNTHSKCEMETASSSSISSTRTRTGGSGMTNKILNLSKSHLLCPSNSERLLVLLAGCGAAGQTRCREEQG